MKKTNTIHFGIQRKIVSNMTAESWETIPHVTYNYEPDVTAFILVEPSSMPKLVLARSIFSLISICSPPQKYYVNLF